MKNDYVLSMEGISKQFPGVRALSNVELRARKGGRHRSAARPERLPIKIGRNNFRAGRNLTRVDGDGAGRQAVDTLAAQTDSGGGIVAGNEVILEKADGLPRPCGRRAEHQQGEGKAAPMRALAAAQ